jgi:hypothetical protein
MTFRHLIACAALGIGALTYCASAQTARPDSPMQTAAKQVQTAETGLKAAQALVQKARDKVKAQLLTKPEWAGVKADLTKAEADEKSSERAAIAAVRAKPEYMALVKQRDESQKVRDAARAGAVPGSDVPKVSDAELGEAEQNYMKAGVSMKTMEKQALADDQPYNDAKARMEAANAKLAQLDAEVDEALKNDPDYLQVQQNVVQAQQAVDQAKQQLVQARQSAADQSRSQRSQNSSGSKR